MSAADSAGVPPPDYPTFRQALAYWLRLGCVSFGGPAGQIALMHAELVEKRRWISEGRFLHALNYCMLLPGPEAQQLATYMGWLMHRTWGGLAAGGLFVLPSLLLMLALSWVYMAWGQLPAVAGAFYGIKPVVTVLVLAAAWRIGRRTLRNAWLASIALLALLAISLNVPFPLVVLAAALAGALGARLAPQAFAPAAGHAPAGTVSGRAVIDEHSPKAAHLHWSTGRFVRMLLSGLGLWAAAMATLLARDGAASVLAQMGWFFTKAALLTFGGAYAVLPYVFQGAVEQFHWLSAAQMMDGLALGETTPGPLIMVVSFVGFVGGWSQPGGGAGLALAAGGVVSFFTFLPSFLFIFLGAPLIESTHGQLRWTAPLTGITAAVVGVVLSLALFFTRHVLWPAGLTGPTEWPALAIGLAAALALWRLRLSVLLLVPAAALAGLLWHGLALLPR